MENTTSEVGLTFISFGANTWTQHTECWMSPYFTMHTVYFSNETRHFKKAEVLKKKHLRLTHRCFKFHFMFL